MLLANAVNAALGHTGEESIGFIPQQHQLYKRGGYLTDAESGKPLDLALKFLKANAKDMGLNAADFNKAIVTGQYTDSDTGVTHIYLRQTYNGLEVENADINVNVLKDGRILSVGGGFVPGLKEGGGVFPKFSALTAVDRAASKLGLLSRTTPEVISVQDNLARATKLRHREISRDDIPARLHYVPVEGGGVELSWNIVIHTPDGQHWYDTGVEDGTGNLIFKTDWVDNESYNVLPRPIETPVDGPRSIVNNPFDPVASPFGWHDTNGAPGAEFTDTRGNNVSAQEDADANDTGGFRPDGGASLNFDFPLDLTQAPTVYRSAAITNLFYWNNILHDVHYKYGFTEAAGNFEVNNYGKGGLGNDAVQADAQDGSGTNNANFSTPPDGTAGRMQMYVFTVTNPNRDGDLDNQIIAHEFGHGVSNRLTGGPANANALNAIQSGGMGEGWSDWWGLMFTQKTTDLKTGSYPVGTYVENNTAGIRRKPYAFDMAVDTLTYDAYGTTGSGGGVTRSTEVHDTGEIWCTTLWDLNWLLIDKYGFNPNIQDGYTGVGSAGNVLALKLVMDALKLQPANPSFIDARNAILQADQVLTGGQNAREIWTAFARRGMGFSAVDASSGATAVTVAFDLPPSLLDPTVVSQSPTIATITPVTSLSFTFSKAMNTSSFSVASDVNSFTGPGAVNLLAQITGFTWSNANQTLTVNFNPQSADGVYSMSIGPNILAASDNHPMNQDGDSNIGEAIDDRYNAIFRFDSNPMTVTSTVPANGSPVTLPLTTIDINVNEAVAPATIGTNDLTLSQGTVTAATAVDADTVRYTVANVNVEGSFTFTLLDGALTDTFGNPNVAFNGSYALDVGTVPFPTPLASRSPEGSLVYVGATSANLGFAGDTDGFTLVLDAGQSISLYVDPVAGLRPTVELRDPSNALLGTGTAPAVGKDALLNSVAVAVSGTYTITVGGVGGSIGNYTLGVSLNAAQEEEIHDGASNDSTATAQNLDSSFGSIGGGGSRAAVLGSNTNVLFSTVYSADFESGLNGYVIDNTGNGLWHQSIGHGSESGHSATHSIYFGTGEGPSGGGTYGTGVAVAGSITSPNIVLPNSSLIQLDFNYLLQTENSSSWDLSQVQVSNDGGTSYSTLTSLNGVAESSAWRLADPLSLSAFAGQTIKLRFFFNSIDAVANTFEGWYVDDVRIQAAAPLSDYYSFTLAAGDSATLGVKGLNGNSLSLQLLNGSGQLLSAGGTAQNLDGVITNFVAPSAGTYYALVQGGVGVDYNLVVTKNAEFDTELNDVNTSAQNVLSKKTSGNQRVLGNVGGTVTQVINFDELDQQPVDGVSVDGVNFHYTIGGQRSLEATFGATRNSSSSHLNRRVLEGKADGTLWIDLDDAATSVSFDMALGKIGQAPDAVVSFLDEAGELVTTADSSSSLTYNPTSGWESRISYSGSPIMHMEVNFADPSAGRFALDNLQLTGNAVDRYAVQLAAGGFLSLLTSTPGDGAGQPQNTLNPRLRILDAAGNQLAIDDNSAGDGRNALLSYTAPTAGTYYVEVSSTTTTTTVGDYVLSVTGNTATNGAFAVASSTPANGASLNIAPTQVTIDFNDSVLVTTLQASDLVVDGVAATGVTLLDNNTAVFDIQSIGSGNHTMQIAAGAIQDIQATPIQVFSATFALDNVAPRIISSSIQENQTLSPGSLVYTAVFDEPMKTTNLDASDFSLLGVFKNVSYGPSSFSYSGDGRTLTINYASLPEDRYTLTLQSADGRFEDSAGNDLDGEPNFPIPPNRSGNGVAGGNFVVNFATDVGTQPFPTPLASKNPKGSLIYDPSIAGIIGTPGDVDSYTLNLDANQTLTLIADAGATLQPSLELRAPGGAVIATASSVGVGKDAVIQTAPIAVAGVYTVAVSGVGTTTGTYTLSAVLNAASEAENNDGPSNATRATAQNIDSSFIGLGGVGTRGAVVGRSDAAAGTLPSEVEPNATVATANNAIANFVTFSGNIYHLGLTGSASSSADNDFFNIGQLQSGDILTVQLNGSASLRGALGDPYFYLYRGSGASPILVTSNDDGGTGLDSMIYRFAITATDTYYADAAVFSGSGAYQLSIYLEDQGTVPSTGGTVTTEVESNDTAATATNVSNSWRRANYLSQTTGSSVSSDIDIFQYQFTAGDLVTVMGDVTSGTAAIRTTLLNSSGAAIAQDLGDSIGTPDATLYSYTIPTSGIYYMQLQNINTVAAPYNAKIYLSTNTPPPAPVTPGDFYSFTLAPADKLTVGLKGLNGGGLALTLQDSIGNIVATGATTAGNLDRVINFTAGAGGTYYAFVNGTANVDYTLLLTKNATFDQENNAISTPQLLSNKVALGAITSGIGLPSGTGTNMGSADLVGTPLAIGIAADGSFTGPTIGMRHNGIEYIRTGTFLAGFTVGLGGTNFTNSTASGNGTAFPVTMQNLTSGALHAVRITGNVKAGVAFERFVYWNDGDNYALVTTTLTNNTGAAINNVALLDNQDPDPGGTFATSNDVNGKLVTAGAGPGAMGLGSDDPRAVVSAEGFFINNPFDIINTPADPNGATADIAINLAFNFGTLANAQSTTGTFAIVFGGNVATATTTYNSISNKTVNANDDDYYQVTLAAGQKIRLRTSTPGGGPGEFINALDPVLSILNSSNVQLATDDNGAGDGPNAQILFTAPTTGTYKIKVSGANATVGEYILLMNNAPTANNDAAAVLEDQFVNVNVLANDVDGEGAGLNVTAAGPAAHGTVSINPDKTVHYTPAANFFGSDSFSYTITAADGQTATASVNITVSPVNDAPSFTAGPDVAINEDGAGSVSNWATAISAGPGETQALNFIVTADNTALFSVQPAIDATGKLTFTPAANASGVANITVRLHDDGGTVNGGIDTSAAQGFKVTVNAVANAPNVSTSPANGDEGSAIPLSISASLNDTDGSEALSILIGNVPLNSTLNHGSSNGAGTWTLTPADLAGLTITSPNDASFTLSVTAKATESSNGSTASAAANLDVTVNNVRANITSLTLTPKEISENDSTTLNGAFTDPGADSHTVMIDWGDGSTPTAGTVDEATHTFSGTHQYLDNNGANPGYTVTAVVSDDDEPSSPASVDIVVTNVSPTAGSLVLRPASLVSALTINENDSINLSGTFSDPGTLDTHSIMIDWGDGSTPEAAVVDESTDTFTATHKYLDDNSTDTYQISAVITDNDGGSDSTAAQITVLNVAPNVDPITGPAGGVRGQTLTFSTLFSDVGTLDTQQVQWDFGNGTIIPFHSSTDAGALNVSNVYTASGTYLVKVTVRDDDGGTTTVQKQVIIGAAGMQGNDLYIGGTNAGDTISVNETTSQGVNVKINGVSQGFFAPTGRIVIYGQAGDDTLVVSRGITLPSEIYGGLGNDIIHGGGGDDILIGGDGSDNLNGDSGNDILIGGAGADSLAAGSEGDLLMAGPSAYDANPVALRAISAEWSRTDNAYADRVNHIRNGGGVNGTYVFGAAQVFNDGVSDVMAGASGVDWFFRFNDGSAASDVISDLTGGEVVTELL